MSNGSRDRIQRGIRTWSHVHGLPSVLAVVTSAGQQRLTRIQDMEVRRGDAGLVGRVGLARRRLRRRTARRTRGAEQLAKLVLTVARNVRQQIHASDLHLLGTLRGIEQDVASVGRPAHALGGLAIRQKSDGLRLAPGCGDDVEVQRTQSY